MSNFKNFNATDNYTNFDFQSPDSMLFFNEFNYNNNNNNNNHLQNYPLNNTNSININGKRLNLDNNQQNNRKRKLKKPFKSTNNQQVQQKQQNKKQQQIKKVKQPQYKEGISPSQTLHEIRPNLEYNFEADTSNVNQVKYICKIEVDGILYQSEATSKKEAKRICADKILSTLYSDTYKKPNIGDEESMKKKIERLTKILNVNSIKGKTAAQLLNEIDPNLGKCGHFELDIANEKKFIYKIPITEQHIICGYGRNKKVAKNEASKLVIKELFSIDIDKMLNEEQIKSVGGQTSSSIKT